jgi:hypothetical protein
MFRHPVSECIGDYRGHPRLSLRRAWMTGTSPAMTWANWFNMIGNAIAIAWRVP